MKAQILILALAFTAACTPREEAVVDTDTGVAPAAEAPVATPDPPLPITEEGPVTVQASGVVEEVNADAGTVTIAHEAIPAYEWPPMTMTFAAPNVDLSDIEAGERVSFSLTRTGAMEGTITSISGNQATQ